ncbi:MAG: glycosyltransferase family 2 protein [Phycisphaerales bacterium]
MLASIIIPTHNRAEPLDHTLARLEALDPERVRCAGSAEIIVVDNNSSPRPAIPRRLANGLPVVGVRLTENRGAAARNDAAILASGRWLVMLDDDSAPMDDGFLDALIDAPEHAAAVCADIWLAHSDDRARRRETGGLPEVPVGCGVAYRTGAYRALHGYDPSFVYYGEEYDLAARLISAGWSIVHDHRFRVEHRRATANRSLARILGRLILNHTSVWQRYAPDEIRDAMIDRELERLRVIAEREGLVRVFRNTERGLDAHLGAQQRTPMSHAHFERLIGFEAAHSHLRAALAPTGGVPEVVLALPPGPPGKHEHEIRRALASLGVHPPTTVADGHHRIPPDAALVPATLAPGPMLDAAQWLADAQPSARIVTAWDPRADARPSRARASDAAKIRVRRTA